VVSHLQDHLIHQGGCLPQEAREKAVGLVRANVLNQANVTAMGDAFFILGILLAIITLGIAVDTFRSLLKKHHIA
jgi:hypothetical protein